MKRFAMVLLLGFQVWACHEVDRTIKAQLSRPWHQILQDSGIKDRGMACTNRDTGEVRERLTWAECDRLNDGK